MRIVLLSSTKFGLRCLEEGILQVDESELVGILTTSRHISISYSATPVEIGAHVDFCQVASRMGCPLAQLSGPVRSQDYLRYLDRWRPDLILALGWYYNVPSRVRRQVPTCLGIHASLLPKYRGGAPIPWAIIRGERETGVTLFHLDDDIDAGDIVAQEHFTIDDDDTAASVYDKAERASVRILRQYLPRLADGTAPRVAQDHAQATLFPQRKPDDGRIDWSWDSKRIRDFIRAQSRPYPGAFFDVAGKRIYVWDATVVDLETPPVLHADGESPGCSKWSA